MKTIDSLQPKDLVLLKDSLKKVIEKDPSIALRLHPLLVVAPATFKRNNSWSKLQKDDTQKSTASLSGNVTNSNYSRERSRTFTSSVSRVISSPSPPGVSLPQPARPPLPNQYIPYTLLCQYVAAREFPSGVEPKFIEVN